MSDGWLVACFVSLSLAATLWTTDTQNDYDDHRARTMPTGCHIVQSWEDGSAIAVCATLPDYVYDPDGQPYANAAGVPIYAAGWYPCIDTFCTIVSHKSEVLTR
jgi:hypothetical protein